MNPANYSSGPTTTFLAQFGITNTLDPGAQLSSAEPLPMAQTEQALDARRAATSLVEKRVSNTTGTSAVTQAEPATAASTVAPTSAARSAVPMSIMGMHKWSGRIVEIDGDILTAELTPVDHNGPAVLADFQLSDLDADEDEEVQVGDLFYLAVRTIRDRGRRRTRTSTLLLRRLGRWSADELNASAAEAASALRALKDNVD
jgi:hypothetical protein